MTLEDLVIDPEFESTLPPLTEEEFNGLETEIVSDGKLKTAITLWNNTIVDGHNRYHILQKHPEIELITEQKHFNDRWEVICWIIEHQKNRRNLTDSQQTYVWGKLYEARKHCHGGNRRSAEFSSDQSGHLNHGRIKEQIANEYGVGQGTIQRAEEFSKGIDAIKKEDPQLADDILTEKKRTNKSEVMAIGKAKEEDKPGMIAELKRDKPRVVKSKEERDAESKLKEAIAKNSYESVQMSAQEATVEDLIMLIQGTADVTFSSLKSVINSSKQLASNNKDTVCEALDRIFSQMIINVKEII